MRAGATYHIYTHANGWENLFRSDENYWYFLSRYEEYINGVADTLTYCLMPNHLHLLVRIKSESALETFFRSRYKNLHNPKDTKNKKVLSRLTILQFSHLLNAYTKSFNKIYHRRGSLFTRSFRRKEITSDSYFTTIIRYIHNNPVHHGFVNQITDWTWSSYLDFLSNSHTPVQQEVIDWFGNLQQFILFHHQPFYRDKLPSSLIGNFD